MVHQSFRRVGEAAGGGNSSIVNRGNRFEIESSEAAPK